MLQFNQVPPRVVVLAVLSVAVYLGAVIFSL